MLAVTRRREQLALPTTISKPRSPRNRVPLLVENVNYRNRGPAVFRQGPSYQRVLGLSLRRLAAVLWSTLVASHRLHTLATRSIVRPAFRNSGRNCSRRLAANASCGVSVPLSRGFDASRGRRGSDWISGGFFLFVLLRRRRRAQARRATPAVFGIVDTVVSKEEL